MYRNVVKPILDKLGASLLLLLTSPAFLVVVCALAVANRGKVWFTQDRPGLHGKIFRVIKFRTMRDAADERGALLPDEERLTLAGRIIRKTSLDELPQLLNVLLGHMSVVGPRPLLTEYLPLYSPLQRRRHEVKPGITGWAQVHGRNSVAWPRRFELDVWYVDHQSFWLDLKILLMTFVKVFRAEGINSAGSSTMEKFNGNN